MLHQKELWQSEMHFIEEQRKNFELSQYQTLLLQISYIKLLKPSGYFTYHQI